MNNMESFPLKSRERLAALEEFCIYGNSTIDNLEKLRSMNGPRHAAKSLASTDASIVIRALVLASQLTQNNEKACEEFLTQGSINYIIEYLNSSNENFRVEAL
jgi:2-methylisocitrate lyase-like PEP mutase family enzyme